MLHFYVTAVPYSMWDFLAQPTEQGELPGPLKEARALGGASRAQAYYYKTKPNSTLCLGQNPNLLSPSSGFSTRSHVPHCAMQLPSHTIRSLCSSIMLGTSGGLRVADPSPLACRARNRESRP